ncbi:MAG: SDR family NAD(P)-dependent oxidoreductase [Deltaproteobacteria bacterium]|nr:SDR family NAD(P)-dependent oxidoreductase [Deltaproteobacteria bacterium]
MRLKDKVAIVVGAGQTPGDTIGNGRATSLLFAREGARVMLVDRNLKSAEETEAMIRDEGGRCLAFEADITREPDCAALARKCVETWNRIDILHNNVGIGGGDAGPTHLTQEAWDEIFDVNLKAMWLTCKHVLPLMREQRSGAIINLSSAAAVCSVGMVAYKVSKAGVNALTHSLAMGNAKYNIRVNAIMPGLMNTPMAIEGISRARRIPKQELIRARDQQVPLGGKMGTAWDTAYAALFLASDEARFITGVVLPVDGGQSARIG